MQTFTLRPRRRLLVAVLFIVASSAIAQQQGEADAKPRARVLSKSELRACMDREIALYDRRQSLEEAHVQHSVQIDSLTTQADELAEHLRRLNPTDQYAINDFNYRNDERNTRVDKANHIGEGLRVASAELQSAIADYMGQCVAHTFLKDDETAILKEPGRKPRPQPGKRPTPVPTDARPSHT